MSDTDTVINGIRMTARYAELPELMAVLQDRHARSIDVVASQSTIMAEGGQVRLSGCEPQITDDGVTEANGLYAVTGTADAGLSEKLGIHLAWLRQCHQGRPDLWDSCVNGMLHGEVPGWPGGKIADPYAKMLMLRLLRGDESGTGVLRAVVSSAYAKVDDLDVLVAALGGVRDAGMAGQVKVHGSLSERHMNVTVEAPEVKALAPVLLAGYRNPFGPGGIERIRELANREGKGYEPGTEPIIHAGIRITNSETGFGRFMLAPHLIIQICGNGLTIGQDALAGIHVGGRQEEGIIEWSDQTNRKALELVASKAQDAVKRFLSPEYVAAKIAELEVLAGKPVSDPKETIRIVSQKSGIPKDLADEIMGAFIVGGQINAAGIMNAVTAVAQVVSDADLAALLEAEAGNVLANAARLG